MRGAEGFESAAERARLRVAQELRGLSPCRERFAELRRQRLRLVGQLHAHEPVMDDRVVCRKFDQHVGQHSVVLPVNEGFQSLGRWLAEHGTIVRVARRADDGAAAYCRRCGLWSAPARERSDDQVDGNDNGSTGHDPDLPAVGLPDRPGAGNEDDCRRKGCEHQRQQHTEPWPRAQGLDEHAMVVQLLGQAVVPGLDVAFVGVLHDLLGWLLRRQTRPNDARVLGWRATLASRRVQPAIPRTMKLFRVDPVETGPLRIEFTACDEQRHRREAAFDEGRAGHHLPGRKVVAKPLHEGPAISDEPLKVLLVRILDRQPVPCDRHQRQLHDGRDARRRNAEGCDHHHVDVFGGAPQRQRRLEAPAEPAVELFVQREGLVGHMLHHGLEAVARRHDLLHLGDQQHQVLRLAGCGDGLRPLRHPPGVDRVALIDREHLGDVEPRAQRVAARDLVLRRLQQMLSHRAPGALARKPGLPARQLGLVPQVVQQPAQ